MVSWEASGSQELDATAEQEYTSDSVTWRCIETAFVAAPWWCPQVTLGDEIAVEVNTKGASPHRQKLQYNDKALPEDDTIPLRRFTGIPKDKINIHLTIVSEA